MTMESVGLELVLAILTALTALVALVWLGLIQGGLAALCVALWAYLYCRRPFDTASSATTSMSITQQLIPYLSSAAGWIELGLGLRVDRSTVAMVAVGLMLVGIVLFGILGWLAACATIAAFLLAAPDRFLQSRRGRFEEQLPELWDLIRDEMEVSHSLEAALDRAATELGEPTRTEVRKLLVQVRVYGSRRQLHEILAASARTLQSDLMGELAGVVAVHESLGGNLATICSSLSAYVRESRLLKKQIANEQLINRTSGILVLIASLFIFAFALSDGTFRAMLLETRSGRIYVLVAGMMIAVAVERLLTIITSRY